MLRTGLTAGFGLVIRRNSRGRHTVIVVRLTGGCMIRIDWALWLSRQLLTRRCLVVAMAVVGTLALAVAVNLWGGGVMILMSPSATRRRGLVF